MPNLSDDDRDSLIATIVENLTQKTDRGEAVDINSVLEQHPEIASDIREIWGTLQIANAVAPLTHISDGDSNPDTFSDIQLPCNFGEYELLEELGRGGMGMVFKARHARLDRIVAIKMLLRGRFATADNKARFHQEIQSAAGLHHPGIVSVLSLIHI